MVTKNTAGISGIIAGLLPLVSVTILSFFTKDFALFSNYISDLGVGTYGIIFNISLILAAITAIPFGFYLYRQLGKKLYIKILFILAGIALAGTGIFNESNAMHGYFSAIFFISSFLSLIAVGILMKNKRAGNMTSVLGAWGLVGLLFFNPLVETIQIFIIVAWLLSAGAITLLKG